jgi:hypothetical protein
MGSQNVYRMCVRTITKVVLSKNIVEQAVVYRKHHVKLKKR